jgi:hypothetical protein
MSAPDRFTSGDCLEPVAHVNDKSPAEITRQLQFKAGVLFEQFLAAVKADGFAVFATFVENKDSAIRLSGSFWLSFAHIEDHDLVVRVAKKISGI